MEINENIKKKSEQAMNTANNYAFVSSIFFAILILITFLPRPSSVEPYFGLFVLGIFGSALSFLYFLLGFVRKMMEFYLAKKEEQKEEEKSKNKT